MDYVVAATGDVAGASVVEATDPEFGPAALQAIGRWKFQPGLVNGRAVATRMQQRFDFDPPLEPAHTAAPPTAEISGETHEPSQLSQQPRAVFKAPPSYPTELRKQGVTGSVLVEFIVTKSGDVVNARAVRAKNPSLAEAAIAAVSRWKFIPGMVDGRAVNTRLQQPISFSLSDEVPAKK